MEKGGRDLLPEVTNREEEAESSCETLAISKRIHMLAGPRRQ
jgi:hypothetical protein